MVMGYSMGGRGTWHMAAKFRAHFVAAIPIAGTPGEIALDNLRDLPLYVIHSEADSRVPIKDAAAAVERLRAMHAPVEFAARQRTPAASSRAAPAPQPSRQPQRRGRQPGGRGAAVPRAGEKAV
ncbi:MAG: dienelactone hydrolase family protein [Candidatus Tectimicrobiota bacterium]